jgi:hypothetical protein
MSAKKTAVKTDKYTEIFTELIAIGTIVSSQLLRQPTQ